VKGCINCAVVSCPVADLRAEMRDLRENGGAVPGYLYFMCS